MMNALANHHILPHNGKGVTKALAASVLIESINLDPKIASLFAGLATTLNPDHKAHSFDFDHLSKHNAVEHDGSLSRNDFAFGDNHTFDPKLWELYKESYGGASETDFASVSKARYARIAFSKKHHEDAKKDFQYGIKEFIFSYGESALFLGMLGGAKDGKIPLEYLRIFFGKCP